MIEGKVALITGAASGIGKEIAINFAKKGAKVVFVDLKDEILTIADKLKKAGYETMGLVCDVVKEEEVKSAINETVSSYGSLDILINNAGRQYIDMIEDFPVKIFDEMLSLMVTAPFVALKHALPHMKKQKFGRIINMASINGLVGFAGKSAYNSSKHGVIGLTKVAALENAEYGITVNALCPGYVDTPLVRNQLEQLAKTRGVNFNEVLDKVIYPLVPQKRLLKTEEITNYALFLASDKAGGITGQAVVIDGGYTVK